MINGIHHVSFSTTDIDRMLAFYRDLLGCSEAIETGEIRPGFVEFETLVGMKNTAGRAALLEAGNIKIEIFQYTHPVPRPTETRPACDGGIRHLAFDVTDLKSEYERLKAAGTTFVSEPQLLANVGVLSVYARDPDGNILELQELLPNSSVPRMSRDANS